MASIIVMKRFIRSAYKQNPNQALRNLNTALDNFKALSKAEQKIVNSAISKAYESLKAKGVTTTKSESKKVPPRKGKPSGKGSDLRTVLKNFKEKIGADRYREATRGTTIPIDMERPALKKGKRNVITKGYTTNQYGRFKNKIGKIYYESRANRIDVNQPSQTRYPKLADGGQVEKDGVMARGGFVGKGEMVWKKLSLNQKRDFLYENFTPQITPRSQEIVSQKAYNFLPKNVKIALEAKYANAENYGNGGGKKYAQGGMTQHGLKEGDKIIKHFFNAVLVENNGENFVVNLNTGQRWTDLEWFSTKKVDKLSKMADGGEMADGGYEPYIYYFYNEDGNEMTFRDIKEARLEAKKRGVQKFRDDLGGEYFVNYADGGRLGEKEFTIETKMQYETISAKNEKDARNKWEQMHAGDTIKDSIVTITKRFDKSEDANYAKSGMMAEGGTIKEFYRIFDDLKKGDKIDIFYGSSFSRNNKTTLKVKSRNVVGKGKTYESEKTTFENVDNPSGVNFYAYKRKNGNIGFAIGDMAISVSNIENHTEYADGGKFGANRVMTYKFAYKQAINIGIDFDKPYNRQSSSDNVLAMYAMVGLADRAGWQKATNGGTGREFFHYLQEQHKKNKFEDGGEVDIESINEEIRSLSVRIESLEEKNTEEAYMQSEMLRKQKAILQAQKLHLEDDNYADGGKIKNQYEGKAPSDIWNMLTKDQRQHFLYDHKDVIEAYRGDEKGEFKGKEIIKAYNSDWADLDTDIKNRFVSHVREGEYADGGMFDEEQLKQARKSTNSIKF